MDIDRRTLLKIGLGAGLAALLPWRLPGAEPDGEAVRVAGPTDGRHLILIELRGGNDGLNTVVPAEDAAYRRLRPRLALPAAELRPLDRGLSLHNSLAPLLPVWAAGQMAVALGVGYPRPNRSHFRSTDIWHAASGSEDEIAEGWLGQSMAGTPLAGREAHAIAVGSGGLGPAAGSRITAITLDDPERFVRQARRVGGAAVDAASTPALAHVLAVDAAIAAAAEALAQRLRQAPEPRGDFPNTPFGRSLKVVARLILAGCACPAWIAGLGGFDTHANQLPRHAALLAELAQGLTALRNALAAGNAWDRCLVVTTSEFGRRAAENASAGTDHGTAGPQFILGGRVRAGLIGEQPSLANLERGDLRHSLDFRTVLGAAAGAWLGLPTPWADGLGPVPVLTT